MPESKNFRRPKPAYVGSNGFEETGPVKANLGNTSRLVEEARRRRLAEWTIMYKGSHFPSIEEMRTINSEAETPNTIKKRIEDLKAQQKKDEDSLYAYYAELYHQEQKDMKMSVGDEVSLNPSDESYWPELDDLYKRARQPIVHEPEWDDALARMRHSHHLTLIPLQTKLKTMMAKFPSSKDEFRAMKNNQDIQLRVAKFLLASDSVKEMMLDDFGWAWRQVQILVDIYGIEPDFREEIQNFVKEMAKETGVRDPRKRI